MDRVFTNGPGDRGSIHGLVTPKTQKMVLALRIIRKESRVNWSNPEKGVAPSLRFSVVAIEKGTFGSPSITVTNNLYRSDFHSNIYIYIYIYIYFLPLFAPNECPAYDTKQSEGEISMMLWIGECGVFLNCHFSQVHYGSEWKHLIRLYLWFKYN